MHLSIGSQPRDVAASKMAESARERRSSAPAALGVTAAMLAAGWTPTDHLYHPANLYLAAGCGLAGLGMLARNVHQRSRRSLRACGELLAMIALCALVVVSADRMLTRLEARARPLRGVAAAVAPMLTGVGYRSTAEGDLLHAQHPEGLVTIAPSWEKLGLRAFAELWCLWAALHVTLDGRKVLDVLLAGGVVLAPILVLRFAACMLVYLEHGNILIGTDGLKAISVFSGPIATMLTLIASGLLLDVLRRRVLPGISVETRAPVPARLVAWCSFGCFCIGSLAGFAGAFEPAGREKQGRVLLDDRLCGVWEPTARLLDTEWYGDFSTYSFSSLAEWLGRWFLVDVNTNRPYTDDLLAAYDVLVLKTPVVPIPTAQQDVIDRFVTAGGGLLLVGDHTNLLGMGTHLNSLCDKYGLRFQYDSVSEALTGGFVDYYAPRVGRGVGAIRVNRLQFMTSCSLSLEGDAEPIVVARSCRRDAHDYANPSFFGRSGSHPELAHGATVLAAWAPAGKGRIAAFTDSTVWSSFAVFQYDRDTLAADLVRVLNHDRSTLRRPIHIIGLLCLGAAFFVLRLSMRFGAVLPALVGVLAGVWSGVCAADQAHQVALNGGPPRAAIHEVSFLWQGGSCAFPPVLGDTGALPLDRAFDTLLVSCQRVGLIPRVAYTYDRDLLTEHTRALFVIAPVNHPPQSALSRIESFVRGGGALVVLDDGRLKGNGSAPDFLRAFGIDLRYTRRAGSNAETVHSTLSGLTQMRGVPDTGMFVGHRAFGKGHVVYMRDASDFSRSGMRHCFARPGKAARAKYDTVFWLFRDLLRVTVDERRYYGILE